MDTAFLNMSLETLEGWLRETDETRLETLWTAADETRRAYVGDEVHLRGLIEISNRCARNCAYCGLRADNKQIERYRMEKHEIMDCAHQAKGFGYGTVVLQAGEDFGITRAWMTDLIQTIKAETGLAVTLSLGERDDDDLTAWREAGADRYLLRFETSNKELYARIHPPAKGKTVSDRPAILRRLQALGYEAGSGVMIGIPGQTYASVAQDIDLFRALDLDMLGVGPYIAHPHTPLGEDKMPAAPANEQVPNTELMTYKVVALTRLVCPEANLPSTTALATLNLANGRELGLLRGANILMPNMTPPQYRVLYEIYPAKACIQETARDCHACMGARIRSIGRTPGTGHGGRKHRVPTGESLFLH